MADESPQGTTPEKKGLSPLAWIAIGCGGVTIIGVIVAVVLVAFVFRAAKDVVGDFEDNPSKAAAELVIRMNPELDLVKSDDEAGTITFRNNETGEEATLNFEDIAEGKFSVTTDEGEYTVDAANVDEGGSVTVTGPEGEARFGASADLSDVPGWVPIYPDATEAQGTFTTETAEGVNGIVSAKTSDSAQEVIDHYKEWLEDQDYDIKGTSSASTQDGKMATIMGELADQGRTVNVSAVEQGGETQVVINYNAKKQ